MQRITLIAVGRLKEEWARAACSVYLQRLQPALNILELPASKGRDAMQQKLEESERLMRILERTDGSKWLLDEFGKPMTSPQFAEALSSAKDHGEQLVFVLGGAYGVTDQVRHAIPHHVRLSDMTLPHELARVCFLEQLYRAAEINKGSGYHH